MDQQRRRKSPHQLGKLVGVVKDGASTLADVDWTALAARVAETSAHDGYPTGSSEVAVMAAAASTSTERAALAGLPGDRENDLRPDDWMAHYVRDDVALAHDEICEHMVKIAALVGAVLQKIGYIQHVKDQKPDREWRQAGVCRACARSVEGTSADPFRQAYCKGCYDAWSTAGCPPDEARVIFDRKRWLAAHPTCTAADEHDWRRRQHTDEHGQVLSTVIPLDGQAEYRRHELPPAIDPDDVSGTVCEQCGCADGKHYRRCSVWD